MRWLLSLIFVVPAIASAGAPMGIPKGAASLRLAAAEGAGGLGNAERLFYEMEYEEVLEVVEGVLVSPGVGPEELIAAYQWKGLSLASLGRVQEAVAVFAELLSIDPSFTLSTNDYSPPQLLPLFRAVRDQSKMGYEPIGVEHAPPKWVGTANVLVLEVLVKADPLEMIRGVNLRYRREETGEERHMAVPVDGPGVVRISLPVGRGDGELYYHFEAVNEYGGVLARCGGVEEPFYLKAVAEVAAPGEESTFSTWGWVVFGVGGALLAGGGVCGGLALSLDGELSGDCPGGACPPGRSGDIKRMDYLSMATNVFLGTGAAVVLVGVVMLFWEGDDGASMDIPKGYGHGSVSVLPVGGEGFSGISVLGRW
jgi:hypothetical protein